MAKTITLLPGVSKRSEGVYLIQIPVTIEGRKKRKSWVIRGTPEEANRKAINERKNLAENRVPENDLMPFNILIDRWFDYLEAEKKRKQSTLDTYRVSIENHIKPYLNNGKLRDLTEKRLDDFFSYILRNHSNSLAQNLYGILSSVMSYAVRKHYITINNLKSIEPPEKEAKTDEEKSLMALRLDEISRFITTAKDDSIFPICYVALQTGMRQGEILALRWSDIDLEFDRVIHVNHTLYLRGQNPLYLKPKTKSSGSKVYINDELYAFISEYKTKREALYESVGKKLTPDVLVFTNSSFKPYMGCDITHRFQILLARANVRRVPFHSLRHSAVSLIINAGATLKEAQEFARHSDSSITSQIYSHLFDDTKRKTFQNLGNILKPAISDKTYDYATNIATGRSN